MGKDEFISNQWVDYRRRTRWFLGVAAFFPFVAISMSSMSRTPHFAQVVLIAFCVLWVTAMAIVALWLQFFPCPNCGKPFFRKIRLNLPFFLIHKCVHCGLPKWEH